MTDWQSLPADLQALMEKRNEERRQAAKALPPEQERRNAERRAESGTLPEDDELPPPVK